MARSRSLDAFDERDFISQMFDGSLTRSFDPSSLGFGGCDPRDERRGDRTDLSCFERARQVWERDQAPSQRAFLFQGRQRHAESVPRVVSCAREPEAAPGFHALERFSAAPERRCIDVQLPSQGDDVTVQSDRGP
jgi:hypothetical protein